METRLGETRLRVTRAAGRRTPTVPAYLSQRRRGGTGRAAVSPPGAAQPGRPRPGGSPPPPGPGGPRAPRGKLRRPPPRRPRGKAAPSPSPHPAARLGPAVGRGPARAAAPRPGQGNTALNLRRESLPAAPTAGRAGSRAGQGLRPRGRRLGAPAALGRNRPGGAGTGPGGDTGRARQGKVGAECLHRKGALRV